MKTIAGLVMFMLVTGSAFAQADFEEFNQGYYINRKGEKIEGWIKYERGYKRAAYMETADAKKTRYLTPYSCREFVLDSVTRFVKLPRSVMVRYGGLNRTVTEDYVQVFAEGKLSLYKHYSEIESKTKKDFTPVKVESIIIRKGNGGLLALTGNEDRDRDRLESMFPDDREIVKAMMSKDWAETLNFIRAYNAK